MKTMFFSLRKERVSTTQYLDCSHVITETMKEALLTALLHPQANCATDTNSPEKNQSQFPI